MACCFASANRKGSAGVAAGAAYGALVSGLGAEVKIRSRLDATGTGDAAMARSSRPVLSVDRLPCWSAWHPACCWRAAITAMGCCWPRPVLSRSASKWKARFDHAALKELSPSREGGAQACRWPYERNILKTDDIWILEGSDAMINNIIFQATEAQPVNV